MSDLTTLESVKAFLSIANTDDDVLLERLIAGMSAAATSYLGRELLSVSHAETLNGSGSNVQMLSHYPVTAVSSVTIGGVAQPVSTAFGVTGYSFSEFSLILTGGVFPKALRNVSVVYTAGLAAIPSDISQAITEWVADRYRYRSRVGEKSKSLPQGGSVSYETEHLPARVKGVLDLYRKKVPT